MGRREDGLIVEPEDPAEVKAADDYVMQKAKNGDFSDLSIEANIGSAKLKGVDTSSRGATAKLDIELEAGDGNALENQAIFIAGQEKAIKNNLYKNDDVPGALGAYNRQTDSGNIKTGVDVNLAFKSGADLGQCVPGKMGFDPQGNLSVEIEKANVEKLEKAGCVTGHIAPIKPPEF